MYGGPESPRWGVGGGGQQVTRARVPYLACPASLGQWEIRCSAGDLGCSRHCTRDRYAGHGQVCTQVTRVGAGVRVVRVFLFYKKSVRLAKLINDISNTYRLGG